MTLHIPLSPVREEAGPSSSSTFGTTSISPERDLEEVVRRIRGSRRIVMISGAGVSTAASIPDFRSAKGLFGAGKGKGRANGVKDLFHVRCLTSPTSLKAHNALITSLASLALSAEPTPFHVYISSLARSGQLLRCYTQNIDSLESRAGLRVGLPPPKSPRKSPSKVRPGLKTNSGMRAGRSSGSDAFDSELFDPQLHPSHATGHTNEPLEPQVVPLHGTLDTLHCVLCHTVVPLAPALPLPPTTIPCPTCQLSATIRSALSERSRRSGYLRPSVVLYGEEHPQGELIGQMVEKDLKSADCLLVAGTSLSIPGVKRIVKEMSKAIHARGAGKSAKARGMDGAGGLVLYLNDESPNKGAEWKGVFDAWVQGDIQRFIEDHLTNDDPLAVSAWTAPSTPTKRKSTGVDDNGIVFPPTPESLERPAPKKRKGTKEGGVETPIKPARAKAGLKKGESGDQHQGGYGLPTPPSTKRKSVARRQREYTPTPMPMTMPTV
ncbi:hypothetical protein IAU60_004450 [Kwoniella sp. DSM 27419]